MSGTEMYGKPYHVDASGIKWWIDKQSTAYAKYKGLKDVRVWIVESNDRGLCRLVTSGRNPVYECKALDEVGVYLDLMQFNGKPI